MRVIITAERLPYFAKVPTISVRVTQLQILIQLLPLHFFSSLKVFLGKQVLNAEKILGFLLMSDRVDQKDEIFRGEVLTIVSVSFKEDNQSVPGEDGLE